MKSSVHHSIAGADSVVVKVHCKNHFEGSLQQVVSTVVQAEELYIVEDSDN